MEGEKLLLSQRQLQRWHLMKMVEVGKITLKEAEEKIGVCYRQARRIRRVPREKGMRGLIHANTGRPSRHRLSEMLRQKALRLSGEVYREFNDTHFTEKLREEEGIVLSRETVRGIRQEAGIEPKRSCRVKKHRKRLERMPQEGRMVLCITKLRTIFLAVTFSTKFCQKNLNIFSRR
jgi:transposase